MLCCCCSSADLSTADITLELCINGGCVLCIILEELTFKNVLLSKRGDCTVLKSFICVGKGLMLRGGSFCCH